MKKSSLIIVLSVVSFLCTAAFAGTPAGVITLESAHSVSDTTSKLESILKDKGMTVFARIDHAAGALKTGQSLRPTELLIFGNPKVGTPLMQCQQTIALDLPQKALIWEDAQGKTWLSYNDPKYLKNRHQLKSCEAVLEKVSKALETFATLATKTVTTDAAQ